MSMFQSRKPTSEYRATTFFRHLFISCPLERDFFVDMRNTNYTDAPTRCKSLLQGNAIMTKILLDLPVVYPADCLRCARPGLLMSRSLHRRSQRGPC